MAGKAISYNGVNLQTSTLVMTDLEFQSTNIELNQPTQSRSDRSKTIEGVVGKRNITYRGYIKGTSASDAESKLDTLKGQVALFVPGDLDIEYAGGTRRYTATCSGVELIGETPALDVKFIEIIFSLENHLGLSTTLTTITNTAQTASTIEIDETYTGSYFPLPIIEITVNSETDLAVLSIKNVTTNSEMILQKAYVATDFIVINTGTGSITINDQTNNFSFLGIFPKFAAGQNVLEITPTSTAHNLDIVIRYRSRFL
jgi:hypothetical protein